MYKQSNFDFCNDKHEIIQHINKAFHRLLPNAGEYFIDVMQYPEESINGRYCLYYKHELTNQIIIASSSGAELELLFVFGMFESPPENQNRCDLCGGEVNPVNGQPMKKHA